MRIIFPFIFILGCSIFAQAEESHIGLTDSDWMAIDSNTETRLSFEKIGNILKIKQTVKCSTEAGKVVSVSVSSEVKVNIPESTYVVQKEISNKSYVSGESGDLSDTQYCWSVIQAGTYKFMLNNKHELELNILGKKTLHFSRVSSKDTIYAPEPHH